MRALFSVEKGLRIVGENSDVGIDQLFGSGAPGGTTDTDNAGLGSLYADAVNGQVYQKIAAGTGVNKWQRIANQADITALQTQGHSSSLAITTAALADSVLVKSVKACKWLVFIRKTSAPAQVVAIEVFALHNATAAADATLADDTQYSKLRKGAVFNTTVAVVLSGAGATQTMGLQVASTETGGVDVFAFRADVT